MIFADPMRHTASIDLLVSESVAARLEHFRWSHDLPQLSHTSAGDAKKLLDALDRRVA